MILGHSPCAGNLKPPDRSLTFNVAGGDMAFADPPEEKKDEQPGMVNAKHCRLQHAPIMFLEESCPLCELLIQQGGKFTDPAFCCDRHREVKFDYALGGCPVCFDIDADEPEDVKQMRREVHALRAWLNEHGFEGGTVGMLGSSPCDAAIGRLAGFKGAADSLAERVTMMDRRVERAETARRQTEAKIAVLKERLRWVVGMLGLVEEQRRVLEHRVTRSWWERWFHRPYIYLLAFSLGDRAQIELSAKDEVTFSALLHAYQQDDWERLPIGKDGELRCPGHETPRPDYVPGFGSGVLVPESGWTFHNDPKDCPDCQKEDDGKAGSD